MKQVETTREAIINRRSVRKYKTDMIPRDIIERIVEAGTYAANGRGHQASIILAVTNKESINRELQRLSAHYASAATSTAGSGSFGTRGLAALLWCPAPVSFGLRSPIKGGKALSLPRGYPFSV